MVVAVEPAGACREAQYTIVRVGHAAGIIFRVALSPYHLLRGGIGQHLHRTAQHHAPEEAVVAEVDTGTFVLAELRHAQGRGVGREVEGPDAFALAGLQHRLDVGESVLVYRADEGGPLLVGYVADGLFGVSHDGKYLIMITFIVISVGV